ncbi:MAG TPA: sigma-70 region 4 domain-containing protein [Candidatus Paceibacterota bacterium]|nr:MAG: hypothetical protein A2Y74_01445 [Actinobacteria bacterium RBG_13_63_9]HXK37023.1 sigma-70 region 4 domain-containing protein [Candidatus Paceibacterota bacterium]
MAITQDQRQRLREVREQRRKLRPSWKLSTRQKDELLLCYLDGMSVADLATRFGIRRQTVAYHLDRAAVEA